MNKPVPREEALDLIQTAPNFDGAVTERRVDLVRRLLSICREQGYTFEGWQSPLYPALDSFGDVELLMAGEEFYDVKLDEATLAAAAPETFGDLVRFFEENLPTLPCLPDLSPKQGCPTQRAFYAVRRALRESLTESVATERIRPATRIDALLPPARLEAFSLALARETGIRIGPETNVERGGVWAALWFCAVLLLLSPLGDGWGSGGFVGSGMLLARLLRVRVGQHWPSRYATLGDLARLLAGPSLTAAATR